MDWLALATGVAGYLAGAATVVAAATLFVRRKLRGGLLPGPRLP